jgi:hypothetical protein
LQAIWRAAAAKPEDPVSPDTHRSPDVRPAARAIADKSRSYGLRPESKTRNIASPLLPGGRRSLACRRSGAQRQPNLKIRFPLTLIGRLMSGPLRAPSRTSRAPAACGQNQKPSRTSSLLQKLRRSRDSLLSTRGNCPGVASAEGVGALLAGDLARSGSQT